jgi:hypothetical protein
MARQQRCLAQITQRRPIGVVSRIPLELYGGGIQIKNKVSLVLPNGGKLSASRQNCQRRYELVPETRMIEIVMRVSNMICSGLAKRSRLNSRPDRSACAFAAEQTRGFTVRRSEEPRMICSFRLHRGRPGLEPQTGNAAHQTGSVDREH